MRKTLLLALVCLLPLLAPAARADGTTGAAAVSISEVYGGGGNTDATYTNDYVELLNRTRSTIDITGWKVEYSSAKSTSWSTVNLSGSIAPFRYYLVRMGSGGKTGGPLPTPDATGSPNIARAGGKIRLVKPGAVVDLVGFGASANLYEGARAPSSPDNVQSVSRLYGGCGDTNRNDKDFKLAKASPRNRSSHGYYCGKSPVLKPIGNRTVVANSTMSILVSATDADNDPLKYTAAGVPAGATFSSSSRTFSWKPRTADVGDHRVTFSVSDGYRKDSETITITVKADPNAGRSTTTLSVEQQTKRLIATGTVTPNHAGDHLNVRLFRWEAGRHRRVAWVQTALTTESTYSASFARPAPGSCIISATFPGDEDSTASSAEEEFSC